MVSFVPWLGASDHLLPSTFPSAIKTIKMMERLLPLCPGKCCLRCQEMTAFRIILAVAFEAYLLKLVRRASMFHLAARHFHCQNIL